MQGASPLLPATQKLKKQLLWHTARPAHPGHAVLFRAAFAVCAEQGNRVQFPDMCRIWTIRLSSCDCGASPRPRDARISKEGHWNCCNGGERRPDERVGGCPLNASVRRPTRAKNRRGACAPLGSGRRAQKQRSLSLLFSLPAGGKTRTHRAFARHFDESRQQLNTCGRKAYRPRGNRR